MRSTLWMLGAGMILTACTPNPVVRKQTPAPSQPQSLLEPQLGEKEFAQLVASHVAQVAPLEKQLNLAFWDASTTGTKDSYAHKSEMELLLRKTLSDTDKYKLLERMRKEGTVKDPQLRRQLELMYLAFQENQIEPTLLKQLVDLSTQVEQAFNTYRSQLDGKELTDNDVMDILKSEKNSLKRQKAWEAYQARGVPVHPKILELVRLRNEAARKLGYANFYQMRLKLIEQDPDQIQSLFTALAQQTDEPFARMMKEVNKKLAARYRIKVKDLRPWHYEDPFFQEAPTVGKIDLDPLFKNRDAKVLVENYFKGVGLDPADIIQRSDLYEKVGKMPHAYCIDMDRSGDVRILANLRDNEKWVSTLHETGHAVYDKHIDSKLPWLLREPSHSFTTEAIAMLFGRQTRNPTWLMKSLDLPERKIRSIREDIRDQQRLSMLVFARWGLVMQHFERELYENPDQDLNKLWWSLKQRYQLQVMPEGRQSAADWAAKIHIALWPAYYHNYLLGELMASQLQHHIGTQILKAADWREAALTDEAAIGQFLLEKVLMPGKRLVWSELLVQATGESLNAAYFVEQFVR